MLSLSSDCVLTFTRKINPSDTFDVFVPSRSVLEFSGELYTDFLHSVPLRHDDCLSNSVWLAANKINIRAERYSCTFRHISDFSP